MSRCATYELASPAATVVIGATTQPQPGASIGSGSISPARGVQMRPKNKLIISQALRIQELEEEVKGLKDSEMKRDQWLDKAKRDAGVGPATSFDAVWAEALAALLKQQEGR